MAYFQHQSSQKIRRKLSLCPSSHGTLLPRVHYHQAFKLIPNNKNYYCKDWRGEIPRSFQASRWLVWLRWVQQQKWQAHGRPLQLVSLQRDGRRGKQEVHWQAQEGFADTQHREEADFSAEGGEEGDELDKAGDGLGQQLHQEVRTVQEGVHTALLWQV